MNIANIPDFFKRFFKQGSVTPIQSRAQRLDALACYEGDFPSILTASKTDPKADDNVYLPLVGHIVDTSVAHEVGDGVGIKIEQAGAAGSDDDTESAADEAAEAAAQKWLDSWAKSARLQSKIRKAAQYGALYGHRYLRLVIDAKGQPVDVNVINPNTVTVTTDPRDIDRAMVYTITWAAADPVTGKEVDCKEITRRLDDGTWEITEWQRQSGAGQWQMTADPKAWPYAQPPIYDCQNLTDPHAYYGRPDVPPAAIAQNQSINIQLSLLSRLLRNHSNPKTIIKGLTPAKNANSGGIQWDASGAILLPDGAAVDQLEMQASGAMAALELVKTLRSELHVSTRTPEVASGKLDNVGPISGAALAILYKPLDEKTSEKRSNMTELLERLLADVMRYAGQGDWQISIVWPDTTPRSALEQRQVAQIDSQLGASKESILAGLGYDPAVEAERVQDEQSATTDNILTALNRG